MFPTRATRTCCSADNVTHTVLNGGANATVPPYDMRTAFLRCMVWETDQRRWSRDICKVKGVGRGGEGFGVGRGRGWEGVGRGRGGVGDGIEGVERDRYGAGLSKGGCEEGMTKGGNTGA